MQTNFLKRFIVGSSLPVFILPLLLSSASKNNNQKNIQNYVVLISFLFGVLNALLPFLNIGQSTVPSWVEYAILGALMGLAVSLIDNLIFENGFSEMYGFKNQYNGLSFIFEPLLYALIWVTVLPFMNALFFEEA